MMILRELVLSDEFESLLADQELAAEGHDGFLLREPDELDNFETYLQRRIDYKNNVNLRTDHVGETFWVAVVDDQIAGRISIRHELNEFLLNFGGHIGYMVRPAFRRTGVATKMLDSAINHCRTLGLTQVLLTCNDDNLGSIKVIEGRGGVLENVVQKDGVPLRRYWIPVN